MVFLFDLHTKKGGVSLFFIIFASSDSIISVMNRQPKLMNSSLMRDILSPHIEQLRQQIFFSDELGIIHGNSQLFQHAIRLDPPFAIDDYRLGMVVKGQATINLNLVEKRLEAGTFVFFGPGTIVNPIDFSADFEVYGVVLFADFPMPFLPSQMPSAFNGPMRDFQLQVGKADFETAVNIIDTLWLIVHQPGYSRPTASSLVAALMHHYDGLYHRQSDALRASRTHEQSIFDRFIYLVNLHAAREHHIGFYAAKLCLTERYLGTIIRQASGVTAKEWIDRALVTRIKVELRHTDKTIGRISDEMHFANPSFFCKYFTRLTSKTPTEYRLE